MKKILNLLLVSILLITLITPQVYADDDVVSAWPRTMERGEFQYIIEGFHIDVYKMDNNSPEVNQTTEGEGITVNSSTTEDELAFFNHEPVRTFALTPDDCSINPTYKAGKFGGEVDTLFIDLDLDLTTEDLEELLAAELEAATTDISFIAEIVLDYIPVALPSDRPYWYYVDLERMWGSVFSDNPDMGLIEVDETQHYVLNRINVSKASETAEATIDFPKEINSKNAMAFYNIIACYTTPIQTNLPDENGEYNFEYDTDTSDNDVTMVMFHNVDNIEFLMNGNNLIDNPITSIDDTDQTVNVENTSKMMSGYIYVGSAILLIMGIALVVYVVNQKQKENDKRV